MIESISIKNFKSIKLAEVNLPSFGAIVGNNAVGKTNLLQALSFIKDFALGVDLLVAQRKISLVPEELFNFAVGSTDLVLTSCNFWM